MESTNTNITASKTTSEKKLILPEYGLRIFNYSSREIYYCNKKIIKDYKKTEALFANSLFSEFLLNNVNNGLKRYSFEEIYNKKTKEYVKDKLKIYESGNCTRDIICIDFDSGVKSFENEVKSLEKKLNERKKNMRKR